MAPRTLLLLTLALAACTDTTGAATVSFTGQAGGVAFDTSAPFLTGSGYMVTLTTAKLHVGAIYVNQYDPESGSGTIACILDGIYVAQVLGPIDLDLLSTALVSFPTPGAGTESVGRTAQVWLLEGDIDDPGNTEQVLALAGTAQQGYATWPFSATVTIGTNRLPQVTNTSAPGANPICQQRIVTPIPPVGGTLTPTNGGVLTMRVDVRRMFDGVDFSLLTPEPGSSPPSYVIPDEIGVVSDQLFQGLRSSTDVYAISFQPAGAP